MNRKNLKKLADYLADLPEGGPEFDMTMFYTEKDRVLRPNQIPRTMCGTAACAAGHATHIPGLEAYEDEITWGQYLSRIFKLGCDEDAWCFSGAWDSHDNTAVGASKRINYMLKQGVPSAFTIGGDYDDSIPLYQ